MKKTEMLIGTMLTLACVGCSQAPSADTKPADTKAKDMADIKALEDRFTAAVDAKDLNAVMAVYVADESLVVFDVVPPRQYVGAAAYRKDWETFLGMLSGPIKLDISDLDIAVGGGDVAYGHSIQHVVATMKGGKKTDFTVRVSDGYKRVNGQWLVAHEHISVLRGL